MNDEIPNDECRRNYEARTTKDFSVNRIFHVEKLRLKPLNAVANLDIRHSFVIGYFVIRHFRCKCVRIMKVHLAGTAAYLQEGCSFFRLSLSV